VLSCPGLSFKGILFSTPHTSTIRLAYVLENHGFFFAIKVSKYAINALVVGSSYSGFPGICADGATLRGFRM